ncbi:MAG: hypothetical protein ACPL25_12310, partial [Ignavibacteria bacterium]
CSVLFTSFLFGQEKLYTNMFFDLHFSEGGLGIGLTYNKEITPTTSIFADLMFSESKDAQEFEYYDYFGNVYVVGKKNRVFIMPLNFGLRYRLFKDDIVDNFRPFIQASIGPAMTITTPYKYEFFSSFKYAHARYTLGGSIGMGAYFGFDRKNPIGISFKYQFIHFFNEGIENLEGFTRKDLGSIFITLNFGFTP